MKIAYIHLKHWKPAQLCIWIYREKVVDKWNFSGKKKIGESNTKGKKIVNIDSSLGTQFVLVESRYTKMRK